MFVICSFYEKNRYSITFRKPLKKAAYVLWVILNFSAFFYMRVFFLISLEKTFRKVGLALQTTHCKVTHHLVFQDNECRQNRNSQEHCSSDTYNHVTVTNCIVGRQEPNRACPPAALTSIWFLLLIPALCTLDTLLISFWAIRSL